MIDLRTETIEQLFKEQIRELTRKTCSPQSTFDYQLSGAWL